MFILAVGCFGSAQAQRALVPIVNYDNVAVATNHPGAVTPEQVKKGIVEGAGAGARKWQVQETADGKLLAVYHVRDHTISVLISNITAGSYSLKYADSINMKYSLDEKGVPVIHPFYNKWVTELMQSIQGQLLKL
jgi:hypothetical protein